MRALRQWRALPASERRLLLLLATLQPLLSLSLRARGFRRTCHHVTALTRHPDPRQANEDDLVAAERLAQLARIAGRRGVVDTTCLRQSLALYALLRRRGLRPEIRLGVDRIGTTPDMHAWVELDGKPLAQPELRHKAFQAAVSAKTASTTADNTS